MALFTTRQSAGTKGLRESLENKISSGTVGGQLAGEETWGKMCLISLRLDGSENDQETELLTLHFHLDSVKISPSSKQKKETGRKHNIN